MTPQLRAFAEFVAAHPTPRPEPPEDLLPVVAPLFRASGPLGLRLSLVIYILSGCALAVPIALLGTWLYPPKLHPGPHEWFAWLLLVLFLSGFPIVELVAVRLESLWREQVRTLLVTGVVVEGTIRAVKPNLEELDIEVPGDPVLGHQAVPVGCRIEDGKILLPEGRALAVGERVPVLRDPASPANWEVLWGRL